MKLRFPLYSRILLWFILNLVFLAVVLYAFFRFQFQLDSFVAGQADERLQTLSRLIRSQLISSPRSQWDDVLKSVSTDYQNKVQFFLFRADGMQLAGQPIKLPTQLAQRLREQRGVGPNPPRPMDNFRNPPPPRREEFQPPRPEREGIQGRPPVPDHFPTFLVTVPHPRQYWVGVRLPQIIEPPELMGARRPGLGPVTLLAESETLSAGGLLFDFTPWITVAVLIILLSVLFWVPLVRGITRSITQVTAATEQIAQGRFEVRVASPRTDELGVLSQSIDHMAARLSGFVQGQKRFLGDIAHELCSPLARMQMALGILEQRGDEKQKAYVADVREELEHMSTLVNELLSFSKAALGASSLKLQALSLREVAEKAVRREKGPESGPVEITVADDVLVVADAELLLRSLSNLVRNALHHAGGSGPIVLSSVDTGKTVLVRVSDHGPGVPEEALAQIFDPFYRLDPSRNRQTGGVGLGLAIVKTCIESCGGQVRCRNRHPNGLEVEIELPRPA